MRAGCFAPMPSGRRDQGVQPETSFWSSTGSWAPISRSRSSSTSPYGTRPTNGSRCGYGRGGRPVDSQRGCRVAVYELRSETAPIRAPAAARSSTSSPLRCRTAPSAATCPPRPARVHPQFGHLDAVLRHNRVQLLRQCQLGQRDGDRHHHRGQHPGTQLHRKPVPGAFRIQPGQRYLVPPLAGHRSQRHRSAARPAGQQRRADPDPGAQSRKPAIDHGGTSANGCPPTDQRGVTRPQGPACDIGAFEFVQ